MIYKFKCTNPECQKEYDVEMKLSEYTSEGHTCPDCGEPLKRCVSDFGVNSQWKCGGAYCTGNY